MKLRTLKRKTQSAVAADVVVTLRVPVGMTPFAVLRALQSYTRNRIRGVQDHNS